MRRRRGGKRKKEKGGGGADEKCVCVWGGGGEEGEKVQFGVVTKNAEGQPMEGQLKSKGLTNTIDHGGVTTRPWVTYGYKRWMEQTEEGEIMFVGLIESRLLH